MNICKFGPEIYVYLNVSEHHFSSICFLEDMVSLNDDQVSLHLTLVLLPILSGISLLYTKTPSLCAISFRIAMFSFGAKAIHRTVYHPHLHSPFISNGIVYCLFISILYHPVCRSVTVSLHEMQLTYSSPIAKHNLKV